MEQIKLDSIREEALYGLKLENDKHEENNIKRVLEIIVVSYEKVFLPHPEEDTFEDDNVRFLIDELSYYMDNLWYNDIYVFTCSSYRLVKIFREECVIQNNVYLCRLIQVSPN